jgi:hypothetical protein
MHIDRGLLGWGVFLVVLGAVPLAVAQGWLPADIRWWELWPMILVGIGLAIILRRTSWAGFGGIVVAATFGAMIGGALSGDGFPAFGVGCLGGSSGTSFTTQSGSLGSGPATVTLEMGCGDITVGVASGTAWRIEGTSDGGRAPSIDATETSLVARVPSTNAFFGARSDWNVTLPTETRLSVDVSQNAGSAELTLGGTDLERLSFTVNAGDGRIDLTDTSPSGLSGTVNGGSAKITLPSASLTGSLTVNAGSIALCAAPGTALRLQANDTITGSYDYGQHGLVKDGDTWTSPDWDTAETRITLTTTANAGSFTLDPGEGCK